MKSNNSSVPTVSERRKTMVDAHVKTMVENPKGVNLYSPEVKVVIQSKGISLDGMMSKTRTEDLKGLIAEGELLPITEAPFLWESAAARCISSTSPSDS